MINFMVFPVVSNDMANDINLNYSQIGLLMAVLSISYAFVQIPAGLVSDRFGGSKITSLSVLILGISGLLLAFAQSYELAFIIRIMMGLSGGFIVPATLRILPAWFTDVEYDKAMGIYGCAPGAAVVITLISISTSVSMYGWRNSLGLVSFITLIAALLSFLFLKDKKKYIPNAKSRLRITTIPKVINKNLLLLTTFNVTSLSMMTGILTWTPLFLIEKHGFTINHVGYTTAILGFMMIASSYLGGIAANRIGGEKVIFTSMTLCVLTPILFVYSHSIPQIFITSLLLGLANTLYFGPTFSAIPKATGIRNVGAGFGILNTLSFIGSSLTAALTGFIVQATQELYFAFIATSIICLLGFFGSLKYLTNNRRMASILP
jgi:MFS family permease